MTNVGLRIGPVNIIPLLGDISQLQVGAIVQSSGTPTRDEIHVSPWVKLDSKFQDIFNVLKNYHPFQLGDVVVSHAGSLSAKYLFSAVVIDWGHQYSANELINEHIVISVARKCIAIAASLGLKSIAFTPWGARTGASTAPGVTALMVQAIATELRNNSGKLENVYLVSENEQHYQWFVDRTILFRVMFDQIDDVEAQISELKISTDAQKSISESLRNLRQSVYFINEIVSGDKITTGNISNSKGVAIGAQSSTTVEEGKSTSV